MIEVDQYIKYILKHPTKDISITISFPSETQMDDWFPYLNKFEDYLLSEALKAKKKPKVALAQG